MLLWYYQYTQYNFGRGGLSPLNFTVRGARGPIAPHPVLPPLVVCVHVYAFSLESPDKRNYLKCRIAVGILGIHETLN